jgi:hypothetical protein
VDERTDSQLLDLRIEMPDGVVMRDFAEQTVALNLGSGSYHGLNKVAARMLERLQEAGRGADIVEPLAQEFGQPEDVIRTDLAGLLRGLLERGLVRERGEGGSAG